MRCVASGVECWMGSVLERGTAVRAGRPGPQRTGGLVPERKRVEVLGRSVLDRALRTRARPLDRGAAATSCRCAAEEVGRCPPRGTHLGQVATAEDVPVSRVRRMTLSHGSYSPRGPRLLDGVIGLEGLAMAVGVSAPTAMR